MTNALELFLAGERFTDVADENNVIVKLRQSDIDEIIEALRRRDAGVLADKRQQEGE